MGWEAATWNHLISMVHLIANLSFMLAECSLIHVTHAYCTLPCSGLKRKILKMNQIAMDHFSPIDFTGRVRIN